MQVGRDKLDTSIGELLDDGNCNDERRSAVEDSRTTQQEDKLPCIGCYTIRSEEALMIGNYLMLCRHGLMHMKILQILHCHLSSYWGRGEQRSSRRLPSWRIGYYLPPPLLD